MSGREWHDVASLVELERAGRVIARIGGREIGVVLESPAGPLRALRNRCPHHGAPLCLGTVAPRASGEPGRYALEQRRTLRCPWHGWEFDLASGRCPEDETMRVATYPVRVVDGRVLVQA